MITFELLRGDSVIGTIEHDQSRYEEITGRRWGIFQPTEDFSTVEPLFAELAKLDQQDNAASLHEPVYDDLYAKALKPILELGVRLRNTATGAFIGVKELHLAGSEFMWVQSE